MSIRLMNVFRENVFWFAAGMSLSVYIYIDEEEDRSGRVGTYRGIRAARKDGGRNCKTLNVIVAILKFIL